uniref:Uncharacterized protein n=1 Tax=Anguilla anguilla TaxID=7936 RepID=A0A0E9WGS7_ANGAN
MHVLVNKKNPTVITIMSCSKFSAVGFL